VRLEARAPRPVALFRGAVRPPCPGRQPVFADLDVTNPPAIVAEAMKRSMAALSSATDRNTPRLRPRLVSLAKKPSTALSQDAEVGAKWKVQRGCRASQSRTFGRLRSRFRLSTSCMGQAHSRRPDAMARVHRACSGMVTPLPSFPLPGECRKGLPAAAGSVTGASRPERHPPAQADRTLTADFLPCEWWSKSIQNMATRKNWHGICVGFSRSLPSNAWWQTKAG
jgi:hypothetical protein